MSTKVNGETRERLGQSAKRSVAVCGQAGRGATVACRRLSGAEEQKVRIFCLPGFVEDRRQICFSCYSLPRFCARPKRFLPGHRNTGGGKVCEKVVDEVPQKRRLANTEVAGPSKMQVLLMRMYLHHHAWRALS